jgi:cytochrome P450
MLAIGPDRIHAYRPFARRVDRVRALINAETHDRRGAADLEERDDVLSLLVSARHEDGSPMSDDEIHDELLTLLVAGHETTATALAWAVERLVRHPDKLTRLTEETRDGDTAYLDAVVVETLRLRPVISLVARRLTEPVQIGDWPLPENVIVTPSIYLMHRRPEVYPDPESFQPERFVGTKPGTYTWIPFGGGVRRCLGGAFAQFEMQVVLRELVKRRQLTPARPEAEPVFRRAITETPKRDAEVVLT